MRALLLAGLLALCLAAPALGQPALKVGVDVPYPPFANIDPATGKLTGFDVEITEAICRQIGRECEIVPLPFDDLIPAIVNGSLDMSVAGMAKTAEREKLVNFSDKYFRSSSLFIEVSGTMTVTTRAGLKGKKIAVQNGTIQHEYLTTTYGDVASIVPMDSFEDVAAATLKKNVDVAFVEGLPAYHKLKQEAWQGLDLVGDPLSFNMNSHIVVAKRHRDLVDQISRAIQGLRASGEYDRISRKYFEFNIY